MTAVSASRENDLPTDDRTPRGTKTQTRSTVSQRPGEPITFKDKSLVITDGVRPGFVQSLEEALEKINYPYSPFKLPPRQTAKGYTVLPSEPRPRVRDPDVGPKKRRARKQGGRTRDIGGLGGDISDNELATAHIPVTNPNYIPAWPFQKSDKVRLRKETKNYSHPTVEHVAPPRTVTPDDEDDLSPLFTSPESSPIGESSHHLPDSSAEVEQTLTIRGRSQTPTEYARSSTAVAPPEEELISAFEDLSFADGSAQYRKLSQTISGRPPFLRRNLRQVFEWKVTQKTRNTNMENGLASQRREVYDITPVLWEEHNAKTSRRTRLLCTGIVLKLAISSTRIPHTCVLTTYLEFKRDASIPDAAAPPSTRITMGCISFQLKRPTLQDLSSKHATEYILDIGSSLSIDSEPLVFGTAVPKPYTVKGAEFVATLTHFCGEDGNPVIWQHRVSPSGLKVADKAEARLPIIGDYSEWPFAESGNWDVGLVWTSADGETVTPQKESTMTVNVRWEPRPDAVVRVDRFRQQEQRIINLEFEADGKFWRTKQIGWRCPLCDRFPPFSTSTFLNHHFEEHHTGVDATILEEDEDAVIHLTPKPSAESIRTPSISQWDYQDDAVPDQAEDPDEEDFDIRQSQRTPVSRTQPPRGHTRSMVDRLDSLEDEVMVDIELELLDTSRASDSNGRDSMPISQPRTPPPQPTFITASEATPLLNGTPVRKQPIVIDLTMDDTPERIRVLRPSNDPLGPTCDPPLAPYTSSYQPTVFDFLQELPLDPFGNQANRILGTDVRILNAQDLTPEDKVIHALWGRWITLNHSSFVGNYLEGFRAFVREYGPEIHRAAGLRALRNFLLTMSKFRYLKPRAVVAILREYRETVGTKRP
ncbi:hypothetical protein FRB99_007243 [Tulasnella sp. 403]|nr:hypothetical protein FRB99_007243 [Tulasnella sp. 403]